jgi:hypothetical protein
MSSGKITTGIARQWRLASEALSDPGERQAFAAAVVATGVPELLRNGQKREPSTQVGRSHPRRAASWKRSTTSAGAHAIG